MNNFQDFNFNCAFVLTPSKSIFYLVFPGGFFVNRKNLGLILTQDRVERLLLFS